MRYATYLILSWLLQLVEVPPLSTTALSPKSNKSIDNYINETDHLGFLTHSFEDQDFTTEFDTSDDTDVG